MLTRILAVIAAILLVGAFALATLGPPEMSLGGAMLSFDHTLLARLQHAIHRYLSDAVWDNLAVPLLIRPVWLLPAALGLVFAGAATTAGSGRASPTRRRRS